VNGVFEITDAAQDGVTIKAMSEVSGAVAATQGSGAEAVAGPVYTRNNPYISTVTDNRLLNGPTRTKRRGNIVFSLDASMAYTPGDSIGVLPENRLNPSMKCWPRWALRAKSACWTTTRWRSALRRRCARGSRSAR